MFGIIICHDYASQALGVMRLDAKNFSWVISPAMQDSLKHSMNKEMQAKDNEKNLKNIFHKTKNQFLF
jgi:hypothetical protein